MNRMNVSITETIDVDCRSESPTNCQHARSACHRSGRHRCRCRNHKVCHVYKSGFSVQGLAVFEGLDAVTSALCGLPGHVCSAVFVFTTVGVQ